MASETTPEFKKLPSNKSLHSVILYRGSIFQYHMDGVEKNIFRCSKRKQGCRARLHLSWNLTTLICTDMAVHNHPSNAAECDSKEAMQNIKDASKSSFEPPASVISTQLCRVPLSSQAELPKVTSMKRAVRRGRTTELSKLGTPNNRREIQIPPTLAVTPAGENFLMFDSGNRNNRILIFSTKRNLEMLKLSDHWFVDGTFNTCPTLFEQLFVFHGLRKSGDISDYFPLAFCLMPAKTTPAYIRVLDALIGLQPTLAPISIMSDYETASINAFKSKFPLAEQRGCYFHFTQCNFRHIQADSNILQQFNTNSDYALQLRHLVALAFIPPQDVVASFEELLVTEFFTTNDDELTQYLTYFEVTWIRRGVNRSGLYKIELWNCYNSVVNDLPKTNNPCEGFHSAFASVLMVHHPTIYKLIAGLLQQQIITDCRIEQFLAGNVVPPNKNQQMFQKRLKTNVLKYGSIPKMEYLKCIAHCIKL